MAILIFFIVLVIILIIVLAIAYIFYAIGNFKDDDFIKLKEMLQTFPTIGR